MTNEISSHLISSKTTILKILILVIFFNILISGCSPFVLVPFLFLCFVGLNSWKSSVMLSMVWGSWLLLLFYPLSYYIGNYFYLFIYSPLILPFRRELSIPYRFFLLIQTIIWDYPLIIWVKSCSYLGFRALEVSFFDFFVSF